MMSRMSLSYFKFWFLSHTLCVYINYNVKSRVSYKYKVSEVKIYDNIIYNILSKILTCINNMNKKIIRIK